MRRGCHVQITVNELNPKSKAAAIEVCTSPKGEKRVGEEIQARQVEFAGWRRRESVVEEGQSCARVELGTAPC